MKTHDSNRKFKNDAEMYMWGHQYYTELAAQARKDGRTGDVKKYEKEAALQLAASEASSLANGNWWLKTGLFFKAYDSISRSFGASDDQQTQLMESNGT